MLIAKISLIGSAYAALVAKNWPNSSNCTGTPTSVLVVFDDVIGTCPSRSTSCYCDGDLCRTVDWCNPASTSKIVSDSFGTRKVVQAGNFNDTACTSLNGSNFYLADTCINVGAGAAIFATSSEVNSFNSSDCTGPVNYNVKTSCSTPLEWETYSRKIIGITSTPNSGTPGSGTPGSSTAVTGTTSNTTETPKLSASIQSSFLSFSAMLAAGFMYTTFC